MLEWKLRGYSLSILRVYFDFICLQNGIGLCFHSQVSDFCNRESIDKMNWNLKSQASENDIERVAEMLSTGTGKFPNELANILLQRGVSDIEDAKRFLAPSKSQLNDPFLMKGMDKACDRITKALDKGERILIYGDYDVDGTTSVSLLYLFFKDLGFGFEIYIPDRFSEGYGISFQGIDYAHSTATDLLIALDCGTKAIDKIAFANGKGIDVIVVDHHQPGAVLPQVTAMLNPMQADCAYPDQSLSACGLTLKLCQALTKRFEDEDRYFLPENYDPFEKYCDLVALSTACDIVPLKDENRTIVHFGIEKFRTNPIPGLQAIKELYAVEKAWTVSDLVFYVGPLINSAGRLNHATEAVALLAGSGHKLREMATALQQSNESRKQMDKAVTAQAIKMIKAEEEAETRSSTVFFHADWSKGLIGIVASRLIEKYYRPTVLFTQSGEYMVGSGRSVKGFDLYAAIDACSDLLVQFGGHKYAAGLTMLPENFPAFKAAFEAYVSENISKAQRTAEIQIDSALAFNAIDDRFLRLLGRLSPFGPSNPEPNFMLENVEVKDCKILKGEHVKFAFESDGLIFEAIGFFMAEKWEAVNQLSLDIIFQPDAKYWKGNKYIQLKLKDFRPHVLSLA